MASLLTDDAPVAHQNPYGSNSQVFNFMYVPLNSTQSKLQPQSCLYLMARERHADVSANHQPMPPILVPVSRIIGNIAGGCIAGLLGLTGKDGAVCYLAISLMISFTLLVKTKFQPYKYFASPATSILVFAMFDRNALLTYVLFWTMLYSFR